MSYNWTHNYNTILLKQQYYIPVDNFAQENGRKPSILLLLLPSSIDHPTYYKLVKTPIDLTTMQQRIQDNLYSGVSDFEFDARLLFTNALTYYQAEDTPEHKDCMSLYQAYNAKLKTLTPLSVEHREILFNKASFRLVLVELGF